MTEHTPGPWRAEWGGATGYAIVGDGDVFVAALPGWAKVDESAEANARLIAESPALLLALQDAVYLLADAGLRYDHLDEAIARAKGAAE